MKNLDFIHNNVCNNLHASLFLNEHNCIVRGLNLHEFYTPEKASLGVLLNTQEDREAYIDAQHRAQYIIKKSNNVKIADARTFS